jgi:uncharacterized membrane protein (DUF2068 family)
MWETSAFGKKTADQMEEQIRREHRPPLSGAFVAIIIFKWLKAAAFVIFGVVALKLARASEMPSAIQIADFFSISRENELVHHVADLIRAVTPRQATGFGFASVLVGGVFLTEGTFLALQIWWATYFTVFLTAVGIPLELMEIAKRPGSQRLYLLLAINTLILVYVWRKRKEFRRTSAAPQTTEVRI